MMSWLIACLEYFTPGLRKDFCEATATAPSSFFSTRRTNFCQHRMRMNRASDMLNHALRTLFLCWHFVV